MSILTQYLNNHRLDAVPTKVKNTLANLEQVITGQMLDGTGDLDGCVQQFAPKMIDLTDRLKTYFQSFSIKSFGDALEAVKSAKNIGFEAYQIIMSVKGCVVPDGLSPEEEKAKTITFGKDMAYFIWLTVNPLAGKLSWMPFKTTLEKLAVRWIAALGIELAYDLMQKNAVVKMSGETYIKAI